jgi:hypothetical protein
MEKFSHLQQKMKGRHFTLFCRWRNRRYSIQTKTFESFRHFRLGLIFKGKFILEMVSPHLSEVDGSL